MIVDSDERLEKFEAMLKEVRNSYEQSAARVESLKSQGKLKGSAIQQAIAAKMTWQNMLMMYERYELVDRD